MQLHSFKTHKTARL